MERSIRWLDRCIEQHERAGKADTQNLFAIVQGGLDPELRDKCLDEMIKRRDRVAGYAIGGLSGGEEKGMYHSMNYSNSSDPSCRYLLANVSLRSLRLLSNHLNAAQYQAMRGEIT